MFRPQVLAEELQLGRAVSVSPFGAILDDEKGTHFHFAEIFVVRPQTRGNGFCDGQIRSASSNGHGGCPLLPRILEVPEKVLDVQALGRCSMPSARGTPRTW